MSLAGGDIEYVDTGGAADAVVLLHGVLMDESAWMPVVERLAPRWRCIVPVLPLGAHRVPRPVDADQSPQGVARLIGELVDALDLDNVTVVGNDTGGALAQLLVAERPELIDRLALVSSDAFGNLPPGLPGRTMGVLSPVPGLLRLAVSSLRFPLLRRLPMTFGRLTKRPIEPSVFRRWLDAFGADRRIERDVRQFMKGDRAALIEAARSFHRYRGPVLIVWAAEDRVMPVDHAWRLAAAFPQASVVLVDDCRTLIPLDRPGTLAELIASFLSGEPVGPTTRIPVPGRARAWYASTGWWCIAIAIAHLAATGIFYAESLHELTSGPLIGALDADPEHPALRGAAFWYVAAGALLAGMGWSARRAETTGRPPSGTFAVSLILLGLVGAVVSPLSPFWIILAIGLVEAVRHRRFRYAT